jgi:hypothetical protein
MSEIIGAAGSVAAASISANATKQATAAQIKALQRQREFVYNELNPDKVNAAARAADVARVQNQLALQGVVDPQLLANRYAAETAQGKLLSDITGGETNADKVAAQATQEALAGDPRMLEGKNALIDAALKELHAGATLPPDVQAELVQTGLQKSGKGTGGAGGSGFGGQLLTTLVGERGLALQKERQERAAGLLGQAQNLEQSRASILGSLFPNLQSQELNKFSAADTAFKTSAAAVPEAGLSGESVANIWLARVGATNQLAQASADAAAKGGFAQAQLLNSGIGQAARFGAQALPSTASLFKSSPKKAMSDDEWMSLFYG